MPYEPKENECGLFKTTKEGAKTDYNAVIAIRCPDCGVKRRWWMNGWLKVSRNGLKYISLSLRPKTDDEPKAETGEDVPF